MRGEQAEDAMPEQSTRVLTCASCGQDLKETMIILAALFVAFAVNHRPRPALEGPYPVNVPEP
jgi:hypothetical protein